MEIRTNPAGRKSLTDLFIGKRGIEVGTERGKYAELIAQVAEKLFVVDLWKSYDNYRTHVTDDYYLEILDDAHKRLDKYDVGFIREDSVKAAALFTDDYLDFIYFDSNHRYEFIKAELEAYWSKLKKGGIYSGHDYKKAKDFGVIQAVNELCIEKNISELTIFKGDKTPSWMVIKP